VGLPQTNPVVSARIAGFDTSRDRLPEFAASDRENIPLHRAKLPASARRRHVESDSHAGNSSCWSDVWICPLEEGHLQAVGRDARKRKQYRIILDGARCATVQSSIAWPLSVESCREFGRE